jgi:hypothetical protein
VIPNCKPTGNQIGVVLCMRIALTTLSITRAVIVTLMAGVNPCKRLRKPSSVVSIALVDHTRRITRGKLARAPGTFLMLNFSSARGPGPPEEKRIRCLIEVFASPLLFVALE